MKHTVFPFPLTSAALFAFAGLTLPASAATAAQMLSGYSAQASAPPEPVRGKQLFTGQHGKDWRCASCHGEVPVQPGKHAATGKTIGALAPAANAQRFTDAAKTEKWFRRNCNDVLGRECSPTEKADVLAWLMALKP